MTVHRKKIRAGILICIALLLFFSFSSGSERLLRLPDGTALRFEGLMLKLPQSAGTYLPDKGARIMMKRSLPPSVLEFFGLGMISSISAAFHNHYPIPPPKCIGIWCRVIEEGNSSSLPSNKADTAFELIDGDKAYISEYSSFAGSGKLKSANIFFENASCLTDELVLRLVSREKSNASNRVVLGEMRVKNPVPEGQRR